MFSLFFTLKISHSKSSENWSCLLSSQFQNGAQQPWRSSAPKAFLSMSSIFQDLKVSSWIIGKKWGPTRFCSYLLNVQFLPYNGPKNWVSRPPPIKRYQFLGWGFIWSCVFSKHLLHMLQQVWTCPKSSNVLLGMSSRPWAPFGRF